MEAVRQKHKTKPSKQKSVPKKPEVKSQPVEQTVEKDLSNVPSCPPLEDIIDHDVDIAEVQTQYSESKSDFPAACSVAEQSSSFPTEELSTLAVEPTFSFAPIAEESSASDQKQHFRLYPMDSVWSQTANNIVFFENDVLAECGVSFLEDQIVAKESTSSRLGFESATRTRNLYPKLQTIESDVLVYQSLIQVHKERYLNQTRSLANKEHDIFQKGITGLGGHEFFQLLLEFEASRHCLLKEQLNIKNFKCTMKRLENELWKKIPIEVKVQGRCDDGNNVEMCQKYTTTELNAEVEGKMHRHLESLKRDILPDLTFQEYNSHYLRQKIEAYLYFLSTAHEPYETDDILASAMFPSFPKHLSKVDLAKTCVSTLFYFQRKPTADVDFIAMTRKWLTNLVAFIFEKGGNSDRMFILNHIARSPADINSWATKFMQFPLSLNPDVFNEDANSFQYALTALFILFSPIPGREEFLKEIQECTSHTGPCPPECGFTLLEEDGTEVEEFKFRKLWYDSDVTALLRQIPLQQMLENSPKMTLKDENAYANAEEMRILAVIGVCSFLLDIFHSGLNTYSSPTYVNTTKTIGRFISSTVKYLSDYWSQYKWENPMYNCCLQVEIDRVLFQCVYNLLRAKRNGLLQLLPMIPFVGVSPKMLWNLLWLFHNDPTVSEQNIFTEKDVEIKLKDASIRSLLQAQLKSCDESEVYHILRTMQKLALSESSEKDYRCYIALEMFEVMCSRKQSFDECFALISTLVKKDIFIASFLVNSVADAEDNVLKCAMSLFDVLPLEIWTPTNEDLAVISKWLLSDTLPSPKNKLSRMILKRLNWGFSEGQLALPIEIHRKVGLLVLEAYLQYDSAGNNWNVSYGISQMLHLINSTLFQGSETDSGFIAWAWQMLFSLKLHVLSHLNHPWVRIFDGSVDDELPHVHQDSWLHPLLIAYRQNHPAACYLVIAMTKTGHSLRYLSDEGLDIISNLVEKEQYAAAVQCLFFIMPFFVKNQDLLLLNQKFLVSLAKLIVADQPDSKSVSVNGAVLTKMRKMIKIQLYEAGKLLIECVGPIMKLWVAVLVKMLLLEDKGQLRLSVGINNVYSILDIISNIAYLHEHTRSGLIELLTEITKPLLQISETRRQSTWEYLFGSSVKLSPLLPNPTTAHCWFAWFLIYTECNQKEIQNLTDLVYNEMLLDDLKTPDAAFKKASAACSLTSLSIHNLPVHRWCVQVLKTPNSHPLLPIMCQNFFLCFFQRISLSGTQQNAISIGLRLYEKGSFQQLLKDLQSKMQTVSKYYHEKFTSIDDQNIEALHSARRFQDLFGVFNAFAAWSADPNLHRSVCFSALEPNYLEGKLKLVFENNNTPWLEYVNIHELINKIRPESELWTPLDGSYTRKQNQDEMALCASLVVAESPPEFSYYKPPITKMDCHMMTSVDWLKDTVNGYQDSISEEAISFKLNMEKLWSLDSKYRSLIPAEYSVETNEVNVRKPCHLNSKCSGPASFVLQVSKIIQSSKIHSHLVQNRSDYYNVLNQLVNSSTENICRATIHIELLLRKLIEDVKKVDQKSLLAQNLRQVAIDLFFDQLKKIDIMYPAKENSVGTYSPAKQFFTTCIDIIGKEIILECENLCPVVLEHLLLNPMVAQLASSFFDPNQTACETFIVVYDMLVRALPLHPTTTMISLFSKVKFSACISKARYCSVVISNLLDLVSGALQHFGPQPKEDEMPIYEIIKRHFIDLFMHDFPTYYAHVIRVIIRATESGSLNPDVWYEIMDCFGCSVSRNETDLGKIKTTLAKFAQNRLLSPDQQLYISCPPLKIKEIIATIDHLQQFFCKLRIQASQNFYKQFKPYLHPIGVFLAMLGHSLVGMTAIDFRLPTSASKTLALWTFLHKLFQAWLDPQIIPTKNTLQFPWTSDEEAEARTMFKLFAMCIEFHHEKFNETAYDNLLARVFNYYIASYVTCGSRNYFIVVCHSAFKDLPWTSFKPSVANIEAMDKALQTNNPEASEFVMEVAFKVPWAEVVSPKEKAVGQKFGAGNKVNDSEKVFYHLAKFLIRSGWAYPITNKSLHQKVILESQNLLWNSLNLESFKDLLDLFCYLCIPGNLLGAKGKDCPEVYVLSFMKCMAGFVPNVIMHVDSDRSDDIVEKKRQLFLQKIIGLYATCKIDKEIDSFCQIIPTYLSDTESIVLNNYKTSEQVSKSMPFVQEILSLLNLLNDPESRSLVLKSTLVWLDSKSGSPLLLPCIKTACSSLTNISDAVAIIECCVTARYRQELQNPGDALSIWHTISSCSNVPMDKQDDLIKTCIEQKACISLYKYIGKRICMATSEQSRAMLFKNMLNWVLKIKPCNLSESKMPLLWDKVLEHSLTVAEEKDLHTVQRGLFQFAIHLSSLANDASGFLSFLGLGKSSYSVNFCFLCRAMAAFILVQLPENGSLRLAPFDAGHIRPPHSTDKPNPKVAVFRAEPHPSSNASSAIGELKSLLKELPYVALKSSIEKVLGHIMDPKYCFRESRDILKELSLQVFPNQNYLHLLN